MYSELRLLPSFRGLGITINEDALIRISCPAPMEQFLLVCAGGAKLGYAINLPATINVPEKVVETSISKGIPGSLELVAQ